MGLASNNSQDMLENLKFTVLGQRVLQKNIIGMRAMDAIHMATIGGAKVLQAENQSGKLEPNFQADLTILRLDLAKTNPVYDPLATIVFNSSPANVDVVIVNGKVVLQDGQVLQVNEGNLIQNGKIAAKDLLTRAKIQMR